jgi:hypothetical protein
MILVCLFLIFAVNARQGMGRREREGGFPKTDATTILADEQKGVFRVLDIGRPRPAGILLPQKSRDTFPLRMSMKKCYV